MIRGAAAGLRREREEFAQKYEPVVRAYLGVRWRHARLAVEINDAIQDVFLACFKDEGVLARVDSERPGGFRPYFYGLVRNVARRYETERTRNREQQPPSSFLAGDVTADDDELAAVFDRAWVRSLLTRAVERHRKLAQANGEAGRRRVELLRLRFEQGLPVREIAERWGIDAAKVHKEYARARDEFKAALLEIVAFHHPGATPAEVGRECAQMLALLK